MYVNYLLSHFLPGLLLLLFSRETQTGNSIRIYNIDNIYII